MATSKEYLQFILDQLSDLPEITCRGMMGEYILYNRGKVTAYLCDNRLLLKITPSAEAMMPDAARELPYEGAREMLAVDDVDDRAFLCRLFETVYDELPAPAPRRPKAARTERGNAAKKDIK